MTPSEVELTARRTYNAVNDTFWSQQEIFDYIYAACLEISEEGYVIERRYSSTTVSGTQEYDFPTNAIAIKRITWSGRKLTKIDMIEDDALTGLNQATTDTGNPEYYWIWDRTISLRPIPGSAATLRLWTYNVQGSITSASTTLEIPTQHHMRLVNYVLHRMAAKDSNYKASDYYLNIWREDKLQIKRSMRKLQRADKFTTVKDENLTVETFIA